MNSRTWASGLPLILALTVTILLGVACQPDASPVPAPTFSPCEGPEDYPVPYSMPCQRTGSNGITTVFVPYTCPPMPTGAWDCVEVYRRRDDT